MADILVVVEHQDGVFKKNTLSVVSAAKALAGLSGGEVDALVLGDGVSAVADVAAGTGVRKVLLGEGAAFAKYLAVAYASAARDMASVATSNFHSPIGRRIASGTDQRPIDPRNSWMVAACAKNLPIIVPGWEDSTLGNIFASHVKTGECSQVQVSDEMTGRS